MSIGTDSIVQNFVTRTCRVIIDDDERLDSIQDGFIHYHLLRFFQTTGLQYTNLWVWCLWCWTYVSHMSVGSSSDPGFNGHVHYPNDLDRTLNETVTDKIRKNRADYNNVPFLKKHEWLSF